MCVCVCVCSPLRGGPPRLTLCVPQEVQLSAVENELAQVSLAASEARQRVDNLLRALTQLDQEISRRHGLLSASEAQVAKQVTVIERKQVTINVYHKKIQQVVSTTGVSVASLWRGRGRERG